jgi:hypothetical protein
LGTRDKGAAQQGDSGNGECTDVKRTEFVIHKIFSNTKKGSSFSKQVALFAEWRQPSHTAEMCKRLAILSKALFHWVYRCD